MDRSSVISEILENEKRDALQRVLSSATFQRSDQLKALLRYVCERELVGKGSSIDEYTVAVEALGRPRDYSALEDGAVRNRIHMLRNKLEHYYEVEHPEDVVRISVPKGSYCPSFHRRPTVEVVIRTAPEVTAVEPPPPPAPPGFWKRPVPLGVVAPICILALVAATVAGVVAFRARPSALDPILEEAWGPLVSVNGKPLICLATAAQLALVQRPVDGPGPVVQSSNLLEWYNGLRGLPPAKRIFLGPSLSAPFWGDVAGALTATQVLSTAGTTAEFLPESALQLPALNKRNLLMFGRPGFSNTVDLFLRDKPFQVRIPDLEHATVIRNITPKPGELAEYDARATSRTENRETAFGLITVMPSGGDDRLRTVVFSATLSPGTQAAAEFFASPKQLQALKDRFRNEGHAGFPAAYQVVVRSNVFNTSALDVQYVAHRVIGK